VRKYGLTPDQVEEAVKRGLITDCKLGDDGELRINEEELVAKLEEIKRLPPLSEEVIKGVVQSLASLHVAFRIPYKHVVKAYGGYTSEDVSGTLSALQRDCRENTCSTATRTPATSTRCTLHIKISGTSSL
jgi:hypothetical protein